MGKKANISNALLDELITGKQHKPSQNMPLNPNPLSEALMMKG